MQLDGHVGLNLLLSSPAAFWLLSQNEVVVSACVLVGVVATASLPDVDLQLSIPHRGPTHSVWFAVVAGTVYAAVLIVAGSGDLPGVDLVVVGVASGFAGVVGHLIGDAVTPMGVVPFAPVSGYWIGLGWTHSADRRTNRRLLGAGVTVAGVAVVAGTAL